MQRHKRQRYAIGKDSNPFRISCNFIFLFATCLPQRPYIQHVYMSSKRLDGSLSNLLRVGYHLSGTDPALRPPRPSPYGPLRASPRRFVQSGQHTDSRCDSDMEASTMHSEAFAMGTQGFAMTLIKPFRMSSRHHLLRPAMTWNHPFDMRDM